MKKLILGLGLLFLIYFKGFAGWYGGITPGSSPTLTGTWTFTGANTEFRNSAYDVSGTTVSAGTKYFEFTPSSFTARNNMIVTGNTTLGDTNADTTSINGEVTISSDTAITGGSLYVNNTANTDYSFVVTGNSSFGGFAWASSDGTKKGILSDDTTQAGIASLGNNDFRILASGTGDVFAQLDSNSNFNFSTGQGVHVSTVTSVGNFSTAGTIRPQNAATVQNTVTPSDGSGSLAYDTTLKRLCVSTGTLSSQWVFGDAQTTACQ